MVVKTLVRPGTWLACIMRLKAAPASASFPCAVLSLICMVKPPVLPMPSTGGGGKQNTMASCIWL